FFFLVVVFLFFFFFQAEDGIRDYKVTGVQTCALPISHLGAEVGGTDFLYEPGKAELLDMLLPLYVESQIHRAFLESVASEFGARSEERRVGKECRSRWSAYN